MRVRVFLCVLCASAPLRWKLFFSSAVATRLPQWAESRPSTTKLVSCAAGRAKRGGATVMTTGERAQAAGPCLTCVAVSLLLVAAVVASFVGLGIDFGAMLSADALRMMVKFVAAFLHPDPSAPFVAKAACATSPTSA